MISRTEIHARLVQRGIKPAPFWAWAMGGDRLDVMPACELDSWIARFVGGAS